jgi:hypothetical protein
MRNIKETSFFLICWWLHLWRARVSLEGADTTSYYQSSWKMTYNMNIPVASCVLYIYLVYQKSCDKFDKKTRTE